MSDQLGSLIIDIASQALTQEDRELLGHPLVGGIILFARNYVCRQQLKSLCDEIRSLQSSPLLIMVDQEGGRVQRFINEFTLLPPAAFFGTIPDPIQATRLANNVGWLMATELLSVGVDLSLAPVLDLNKGVSTVIGERAFHRQPSNVIELATAFMQGMQEAGMAAIGKHFPGHGSVTADSHLALPTDSRSFDQVANDDMVPFQALIKNGINGIMAAHIVFPAIDAEPVGFSPFWLKHILRERLNFSGTIVSDDLNMEGANVSASYADRFLLAKQAGCDFVLLCNNRKGVIEIIEQVASADHQLSAEKWQPLVGKYPEGKNVYQQDQRWQQTQAVLQASQHH